MQNTHLCVCVVVRVLAHTMLTYIHAKAIYVQVNSQYLVYGYFKKHNLSSELFIAITVTIVNTNKGRRFKKPLLFMQSTSTCLTRMPMRLFFHSKVSNMLSIAVPPRNNKHG